MRFALLISFVAATASAAASASAQQPVPTRTFAKPDVEYGEPFSQLASLHEIRDGRVVVADVKDRTLQAIDLRSGKATRIGREGAGPQEWALPIAVYPWLADSVLVNDALNSRFLVLAPDATPVHTWSPIADALNSGPAIPAGARISGPPPPGAQVAGAGRSGIIAGGGPRILSSGMSVKAIDSRGRLYTRDTPISIDDKGNIVSSDSAPIVRFDPVANKRDTIAYVNLPKNAANGSARSNGTQQSVTVRVGVQAPFAAADDWTVLRDGTVAILRVADYHLELFFPDGRRVAGKPVPFTPVRVTEADKQQWRDAQKNGTAIIRTVGGSPGSGGSSAAPQLPATPEPASWPATKPPFVGNAMFAAPNGDLWVLRARAAADKVPTADVFNAQGRLVGHVTFPPDTRLVALEPKGVYLVRVDSDDLQYLQRHAISWGTCTADLKESCAKH